MQSGTLLHLAILRKISQLPSAPHPKKRSFFSSKHHYQSRQNAEENEDVLNSLEKIVQSKTKKKISCYKESKKKNKKIDNLTISAWSIDDFDQRGEQQEEKNVHHNQISKEKRYSHARIKQSFQKKKPIKDFIFSNHYYSTKNVSNFGKNQHKDAKSLKQIVGKNSFQEQKFQKITKVSLHLDKQNLIYDVKVPLISIKNKGKRSIKLPSFQAFVSQIKHSEKHTRK